MINSLEGLLERLKIRFPSVTTLPSKITKENVNDVLYNISNNETTIIDLTIIFGIKFQEPINIEVRSLLSLGANVSPYSLAFCPNYVLDLFFEFGADPNMKAGQSNCYLIEFLEGHVRINSCTLCIDYGAKIPKDWDERRNKLRDELIEYSLLSNRRVQECKRCLLAIAYVCNISPFRPVGEILLSAARQVWAMRGGEGVGPRGHNWIQNL